MSHFANFGGFGESWILGHVYSFVTRRSTRNQLAVTEPPHLRTSSKLNATISHHAKPGDGGCNTSGAMSQWDVVRPCQPPEILALQTGPMCGASESLRSRAKMPVSKGIQRIPKAVPVHFLLWIGPNQQASKFPLGLEHIVNMLNYIDLHNIKHFTAFFWQTAPTHSQPQQLCASAYAMSFKTASLNFAWPVNSCLVHSAAMEEQEM